jgi:hypothetical protein
MRKTLFTTAALLVLASVPPAGAAELTREDFTARVEPICKTNTEANRRIFEGAKEEVRTGQLKRASRRFTRAVGAFAKTIEQLWGVPQPSADEARLAKWLGYLQVENDYLRRIGRALAAEDKPRVENLSVRLKRNSNLANNTVLGFGFHYCRIDPSRFS